jgi:hypothetical protein
MVKIERRYINGVLKQEIIYPDKPRDRSLLLFTLVSPFLIISIISILGFFAIIIFLSQKYE